MPAWARKIRTFTPPDCASQVLPASAGDQPTVDRHGDAGDVLRQIGRQEHRGIGDILRIDRTTERMELAVNVLLLIRHLTIAGLQRNAEIGRHARRADRIDADFGLHD